MYIAYLCLISRVDKETGAMEMVGAGIFSEPGNSLTTDRYTIYSEILRQEGESFAEARQSLLSQIKFLSETYKMPSYQWIYERLM